MLPVSLRKLHLPQRVLTAMLRVLVVRHGLTHENVAGVTQGHAPGSLTPLGRAQAAALVRLVVCNSLLCAEAPRRRRGWLARASAQCTAQTWRAAQRLCK